MQHLRKLKMLVAVAACHFLFSHAAAQRPAVSEPVIIDGGNYESTLAALDLLAHNAGKNRQVFLIARLGRGESSPELNRQRLLVIRKFLTLEREIPEKNITAATGERTRGAGRIEVFVCGEPPVVFTLPRNKTFAGEP